MGRCKSIIPAAILAVALVCPVTSMADDSGLLVDAGVEKKINKTFSLNGSVELRTRNDFRTVDRVSVGVGARYKFTSWLKADVGYQLLIPNNSEKLTYNEDGSYNHWRPSFYAVRHRFAASLTGDVDLGRINVSLRERWQYTYRPEASTTRYDFDLEDWEDCTVRSKHTHVLRSRLKLEYNIPHTKLTPYVSAELYTSSSLEKTRFTVGASYTIKKRHSLDLGYRYQLYNSTVNPDECNTHHVTAGYTFKF